MFKIGEFSKLSHVTVKTLRYYDEIGLLKPVSVDPKTNYRYYSAQQLPRLNRILALKDLGLSLEEIQQLVNNDLPVEQIRGMLRLKRLEIQDQIQERTSRLERVEHVLRKIEQEEQMPAQSVSIKPIDSQNVLYIRDTIPNYAAIGDLFNEIFGFLGKNQLQLTAPPMGIYHDPEYREQDVDVEVAVPVETQTLTDHRVQTRTIPSSPTTACVFHEGGYETIGASYGALMEWIEENEYHITGPVREVYIRGPESGDSSNYLTEIQIPVEK